MSQTTLYTRSPKTEAIAYPWVPDQEDGTYCNPVIFADYSDPDVVACADGFYMVASSFNCTPGLPILHSLDLVNWRLVNHAIKNLPNARFREVQPGHGVWAPSIRFHDGKYWIFFPMPDEGIYVTTAEHPTGSWSEPHLMQPGKGLIDPCPLWDDDGQAYLVFAYAKSRAGIKHKLHVRPMAVDGSHLLGPGHIVFEKPDVHPTTEGPKFYKHDGWYYILAPAGGVETGWQLALRSRHIYGPYEEKVVLEQGRIQAVNGPHQGALVDDPDGNTWFVHFQDVGLYGRVTHLQPVRWEGGWPLMGEDYDDNGIGEPVLSHRKPSGYVNSAIHIPQTSDEFDGELLGLQWQWQANHEDRWYSLADRPGFLRLFGQPDRHGDLARFPGVLAQKFPARDFAVETELHLGDSELLVDAGLAILGREHASVALEHTGAGCDVVIRENNREIDRCRLSARMVRIRLTVTDGGDCRFFYAPVGNGDLEYVKMSSVFQATAGTWIGAKVGVYARCRTAAGPEAHADFAYFRFSENV